MDGTFFFKKKKKSLKGKSVIAGGDEEGLMEKFFAMIQKHIKLPQANYPEIKQEQDPIKLTIFPKPTFSFHFPTFSQAKSRKSIEKKPPNSIPI
jgi:hypothetical protein